MLCTKQRKAYHYTQFSEKRIQKKKRLSFRQPLFAYESVDVMLAHQLTHEQAHR